MRGPLARPGLGSGTQIISTFCELCVQPVCREERRSFPRCHVGPWWLPAVGVNHVHTPLSLSHVAQTVVLSSALSDLSDPRIRSAVMSVARVWSAPSEGTSGVLSHHTLLVHTLTESCQDGHLSIILTGVSVPHTRSYQENPPEMDPLSDRSQATRSLWTLTVKHTCGEGALWSTCPVGAGHSCPRRFPAPWPRRSRSPFHSTLHPQCLCTATALASTLVSH